MNLKISINFNRIIQVLTGFIFCSFVIFESYSWGRYILLGGIIAIFILSVIRDGFKYKVYLCPYIFILALFTAYVLITALWAKHPEDAVLKAKTLFEILLLIFVLYNSYSSMDNSVSYLLEIVKWSSYVIVVYSIFFYGIKNIIILSQAESRLDNSYTNVNTIGMLASIGVLVQIDEIIREKRFLLSALFCIPSLIIIAVTQSRKALIVLVLGVILSIVFRNIHSKDFRRNIIRVAVSIAIIILVLSLVLSLPIFNGVLERINYMFASFTGEGLADNSANVRNQMVEIGLTQFLKTPFFGIGIDNGRYLVAEELGLNKYFHNNYVELLACGGIIGFIIYYSMYLYLFRYFFKYRKYKNQEYYITLIIMILLLVLDYGMVSYYNKIRYIYLLIFFLEIDRLKVNYRKTAIEG